MTSVGTPLPLRVMKPYIRPTIVKYKTSRQPCSRNTNFNTSGRYEYLFPPVNRLSLSNRSSFNGLATDNKPVTPQVHCSNNPTGATDLYWKFKRDVKKWCDKQWLPIGAAVFAVVYAFDVVLFAFVGKTLIYRYLGGELTTSDLELGKLHLGIYYPLLPSLMGSPLLLARSTAVLCACMFGTPYVMKRLSGKEEADTLISMITGFVIVVVSLLVTGMRSHVITTLGVINALLFALVHKLEGKPT